VHSRATVCTDVVKAQTSMANVINARNRDDYLRPAPRPGQTRNERGHITSRGQNPTIACSERRYLDPRVPGMGDASTHTEGKIIQAAWAQEPPCREIVLRTNWNCRGELRNDPCPMCMYSICTAADECEMAILECVEDPPGGPLVQREACTDARRAEGEAEAARLQG
jgi:hypothetical protein